MRLYLGYSSIDDSNEFLRSLWTEMKREFGKCAWQYTPYKNGQNQTITFGFMDIGLNSALEVGITYERKGCIKEIFFKDKYGEKEINKKSDLYNRIKHVVNNAKTNQGSYSVFRASKSIQSFYSLTAYSGENFSLETMSDDKTLCTFEVKAYDDNQANEYYIHKLINLINFLSVETNAVFNISERGASQVKEKAPNEIYLEENYIDDNPVNDNLLVISKEAYQIIDRLFDKEMELPVEFENFLKACSHFHTARRIERKMVKEDENGLRYVKVEDDEVEIATVLYLSALEVITLNGFEEDICETCNQPKYQISKRVRDLTSRYLPKHLVKNFNEYYDKRSKFLHAGEKGNLVRATSSSVPLLDVDAQNGCKTHSTIPLMNIREYVSYCMRNYYKEYLMEKILKI